MKKIAKSVLGVTLLEVMLVLAIAAMIIVMSVRYYQTASASQQANGMTQMIQGIATAADGLAQASGSYSQGGVSQDAIAAMMPSGSMTSPWGGTATIDAVTGNSYEVTFDLVPEQVCRLVVPRLIANQKYTGIDPATAADCTAGSNTVTFTYDAAL